MAYSMSLSLDGPADAAANQEWDVELSMTYSGDLLPYEFYVDGELEASYPNGNEWRTSVSPSFMTYGTWEANTNYTWYIRYAESADTKTWNGSAWEFTGLSYTTTSSRTFTTKAISYSAGPTPGDETYVTVGSVTSLRVPVSIPYTWLQAGNLDKIGTGRYYVVNGTTYGTYPNGMTYFHSPTGFGTTSSDSDWFTPEADTEYTWYVVLDYDDSTYQSDTFTFHTYPEGTEVEISGTIAGTSTFTLASGLPAKATDPSPANTATGVNLSTSFSWTNGARTDTTTLSMNVADAGYVDIAEGLEEAAYSFAADMLNYGISVKWKITSSNAYGDTIGDEWTFTSLEFDRPYPSWVLIDGGGGDGPADDGIEGTDFLYTGINNMITVKALAAAAKNRIYYNTF